MHPSLPGCRGQTAGHREPAYLSTATLLVYDVTGWATKRQHFYTLTWSHDQVNGAALLVKPRILILLVFSQPCLQILSFFGKILMPQLGLIEINIPWMSRQGLCWQPQRCHLLSVDFIWASSTAHHLQFPSKNMKVLGMVPKTRPAHLYHGKAFFKRVGLK